MPLLAALDEEQAELLLALDCDQQGAEIHNIKTSILGSGYTD
ncbi:hypothetical protein R50076_33300 [Gilvimarinus japonicus]